MRFAPPDIKTYCEAYNSLESVEEQMNCSMEYRAQGQSHTSVEFRYLKEMAYHTTGEERNYLVNGSGKESLFIWKKMKLEP